MRSKTLILLQRLIQTPYSGPLKEYQIKSSFNFKHFKLFFTRVCFRTSTSACLCLLISEFLTVTWRSCSSAAHPSTSRSADAPAEPRWSVSVCLCVCYLYCAAALLPCSLCAGYHGNWPGVRPGQNKRSPPAFSPSNQIILLSCCVIMHLCLPTVTPELRKVNVITG